LGCRRSAACSSASRISGIFRPCRARFSVIRSPLRVRLFYLLRTVSQSLRSFAYDVKGKRTDSRQMPVFVRGRLLAPRSFVKGERRPSYTRSATHTTLGTNPLPARSREPTLGASQSIDGGTAHSPLMLPQLSFALDRRAATTRSGRVCWSRFALSPVDVSVRCPACGFNDWQPGEIITAPRRVQGSPDLAGPSMPMIQLVCKHCANTRLFAAVPILGKGRNIAALGLAPALRERRDHLTAL